MMNPLIIKKYKKNIQNKNYVPLIIIIYLLYGNNN